MHVTIFADVDTRLNPYVLLFKKALERQGIIVFLERRLTLNWLVTKGQLCECINLQWIDQAYTPEIKNLKSSSIKKIIDHRFVKALLQTIRLLHFSIVLLTARFIGKKIVYTVHDLDVQQKQSLRGIILIRLAHKI